MSGAEEEWVKAAMTDDTMVVELLVRLHAAAHPPPPPQTTMPLDWSVRQRRSKSVSLNTKPKKQGGQSQRASPTTPLSWSGATSLSGGSGGAGGGGSEESSRPCIRKPSTTTRSKVNGDSKITAPKRSRKKKTLAELRDEETSLVKERRELKREIAALRVNLEDQRSKSENLKRMKTQLQPLMDREITSVAEASILGRLQPKTGDDPIPPIMPPIISGVSVTLRSSTSHNCPERNAGAGSDPTFVLPDLNIPFKEDPHPDVICGVS